MAKEITGWIRLYRSSFNNRLYFSEPFTRWQAWCDLLLLANHKSGMFRVRGIKVEVLRGQTGFSAVELADRWRWSRGKVNRFLVELKDEQQIVQQKNNVTTLISIVNYDKYQTDGTANGTLVGTLVEQKTVHLSVHETDINKNDNKDKEENNKPNYNGFACYDAEQFILENEITFEKICIATGKKSDEVKKQLHLYHLWLAKKELYPMGKGAVTAGIESWILNADNFKKTYNGTDKQATGTTKFNAGAIELLNKGKKRFADITGQQND